jgi:hypothetical protein
MADADIPLGIDRARHQDLSGRGRHVWWRRAALIVLAAMPLLGLLNVFGQRSGPQSYQSPAASLRMVHPELAGHGPGGGGRWSLSGRRRAGGAGLILLCPGRRGTGSRLLAHAAVEAWPPPG